MALDKDIIGEVIPGDGSDTVTYYVAFKTPEYVVINGVFNLYDSDDVLVSEGNIGDASTTTPDTPYVFVKGLSNKNYPSYAMVPVKCQTGYSFSDGSTEKTIKQEFLTEDFYEEPVDHETNVPRYLDIVAYVIPEPDPDPEPDDGDNNENEGGESKMLEQDVIMYETTDSGETTLLFPVTKVENVEGAITSITNPSAGILRVTSKKGEVYTNNDIEIGGTSFFNTNIVTPREATATITNGGSILLKDVSVATFSYSGSSSEATYTIDLGNCFNNLAKSKTGYGYLNCKTLTIGFLFDRSINIKFIDSINSNAIYWVNFETNEVLNAVSEITYSKPEGYVYLQLSLLGNSAGNIEYLHLVKETPSRHILSTSNNWTNDNVFSGPLLTKRSAILSYTEATTLILSDSISLLGLNMKGVGDVTLNITNLRDKILEYVDYLGPVMRFTLYIKNSTDSIISVYLICNSNGESTTIVLKDPYSTDKSGTSILLKALPANSGYSANLAVYITGVTSDGYELTVLKESEAGGELLTSGEDLLSSDNTWTGTNKYVGEVEGTSLVLKSSPSPFIQEPFNRVVFTSENIIDGQLYADVKSGLNYFILMNSVVNASQLVIDVASLWESMEHGETNVSKFTIMLATESGVALPEILFINSSSFCDYMDRTWYNNEKTSIGKYLVKGEIVRHSSNTYCDLHLSRENFVSSDSLGFNIVQQEHQTITVTMDGIDYTESTYFTSLDYNKYFTVTITPDAGYTAGTLNITEGYLRTVHTIGATPPTVDIVSGEYSLQVAYISGPDIRYSGFICTVQSDNSVVNYGSISPDTFNEYPILGLASSYDRLNSYYNVQFSLKLNSENDTFPNTIVVTFIEPLESITLTPTSINTASNGWVSALYGTDDSLTSSVINNYLSSNIDTTVPVKIEVS